VIPVVGHNPLVEPNDHGQKRGGAPRGTRPDAVSSDALYLFKSCDELRLTYQIRLLAYFAHTQAKRLVIVLRPEAKVSPVLGDFVDQLAGVVVIERGRAG